MIFKIGKSTTLFSVLVILLVANNFEVEARKRTTLRDMSVHQLRNIKCEGGILEVCNYIGSYCHAEILTSRKRRDTVDKEKNSSCKICREICYNKNYWIINKLEKIFAKTETSKLQNQQKLFNQYVRLTH